MIKQLLTAIFAMTLSMNALAQNKEVNVWPKKLPADVKLEIRELLLDAERSGSSVAHDCVDDILNKKITAKEAVGQYRSRIS